MADAETVEDADLQPAVSTVDAEIAEEQDDASSILSDPEDEPLYEEEHQSSKKANGMGDGEQLASQRSLEDDSEAETERLDQTPQKPLKHADSIGKTPSKLREAATAEDELSDPPSPLLVGAGAASSTSTVATTGIKRKRSDTAESPLTSAESDLGESPRKRSHESPVEPEIKAGDGDEEGDTNGAAEPTTETADETIVPDDVQDTPLPTTAKGFKGRKGKPKGKKAKEAIAALDADAQEEPAEPEQEPDEETVAKNAEQRQRKAEASTLFEDFAKEFTAFREKLYNERLAAMNAELHLLNQPDCQHPEYLRQVACVEGRHEKQIREANAYYTYRLKSMRDHTIGDRSQLHSQYFQHVRELRENVLYDLGEDWYNIQKERRQQHQEKDEAYLFKFPTKKSVQIRQQAKYNQEVSLLSGVAKYVGFPAAPDIMGAEGASLDDDLRAMKIPRRAPQPAAAALPPQGTLYQRLPSVSAQNERLAHEQFIEQNAWAQPQRPIHTHITPNLQHTPDWAEPQNSTRNLLRNLSGQVSRRHSPYATPMPQKRAQLEQSSSGTVVVNSDGLEPPSSVQPAPPTSDRIQLLNQVASSEYQHSPLLVNKHRQNGGGAELTGFRNISNISGVSGASTIDAPPDSSAEQEHEHEHEHDHQQQGKTLPALLSEVSAPHQVHDSSQMHRHGEYERRDFHPNAGFRPQVGAFGTPAPLPSTTSGP